MKYTNILLSLFVTIAISSSCGTPDASSTPADERDSMVIDSVDSRTEMTDDSVKKKSVPTSRYTSKCEAYRIPMIS